MNIGGLRSMVGRLQVAAQRRVGIDEDHFVEVLTEMDRRTGGEGKPPAFWFIAGKKRTLEEWQAEKAAHRSQLDRSQSRRACRNADLHATHRLTTPLCGDRCPCAKTQQIPGPYLNTNRRTTRLASSRRSAARRHRSVAAPARNSAGRLRR